uniref:Uncharacterized protein n=1 Tax=Oryza glumipatula TaxID=40148 RepID=A0A0D9YAQ3_9ORYZ
MFFQRKNSKKVKDSNGSSSKKDKDSRGKNIFDSSKGGLGALAGTLQTAKNDAGEKAENLQDDVKTTIGAILRRGSGVLEKAKEIGGHSEASQSKELEQGSEEQGKKDMEALTKVMDKVKEVKSNPEVVEKLDKVKEDISSLAHALHLGKHDKEHESEEKAKEGETAKRADEGASASKSEDSGVVVQAVEEIQAVVTAVQQQLHTEGAAAETPNEAAAAETSAEGEKPEESKRDVEKDDPSKRLDFKGFFAMIFERCCNPGNKKKD